MASLDQETTKDPAALAGTEADAFYTVQNVGRSEVKVKVAAAAPDRKSRAFTLVPPGMDGENSGQFKHAADESIWIWSGQRNLGAVVYERAD